MEKNEDIRCLPGEYTYLQVLLNAELAGITFVRDYMQFLFDGPVLNAYIWPVVSVGDTHVVPGQSDYQGVLCGCIGKTLFRMEADMDQLVFMFEGGIEMRFSLRENDRQTVEVLELV